MNTGQERVDTAYDLFRSGMAGMRWHSMICACDECLNADALAYIYGGHEDERYKPDITGLLASRVAH